MYIVSHSYKVHIDIRHRIVLNSKTLVPQCWLMHLPNNNIMIICSIGRRLIIIHKLRNRTSREILRGTCKMYAHYTNILLLYYIIRIITYLTTHIYYRANNLREIKNLTCIMCILYRCMHMYIQLLNFHKIEAYNRFACFLW